MEVLTKIELRIRHKEIFSKIKNGAVFIHPTDTIYGLGCNALDNKAIEKLRRLKDRSSSPFSVWVPSLTWIKEHCQLNAEAQQWFKQLPGPYTIITTQKDKNAVAPKVNPNTHALGIRYPDHWFGAIVEELQIPLVTTSANKAGQPFMTSIEDLDPDIEKCVEFIIYEGEKKAQPSKIIDTTKGTIKER